MADQDWETVVLKKKKEKPDQRRPEQAAARAMQSGQAVESLRKQIPGTNKQRPGAPQNARKLDDIEQHDDISHAEVSRAVMLRIQQGRQAKGWTQKDLANAICEKVTVVNEYEGGKGIPNQQILAKMERALGVKLRGKLT